MSEQTFARLERLTDDRAKADARWRAEILRLAKVYSLRLIAEHAGVTHTAIWKMIKREKR